MHEPRHVLATALLGAATALAQTPVDAGDPTAPWPGVATRFADRGHRVLVAFAPRFGVRCGQDRPATARAPAVQRALQRALGGRRVTPLFAPDHADRRGAESGPLPNLDDWHVVHARSTTDAARTVTALRSVACVRSAYIEPRPAPFDSIPTAVPDEATPALRGAQTYLRPAPLGLDHEGIAALPGARGAGRRLAILEGHWATPHEDLPRLSTARIVTAAPIVPDDERDLADHALATAGVLLAARDRRGVDGMVPEVEEVVLADIRVGAATAFDAVLRELRAGDVLCCSFGYAVLTADGPASVPVDWDPATREIIAHAAARGVVVCLAAGNGGRDLGDEATFGPVYAAPELRSGAILVGASAGPQKIRAADSNHGTAIDASGHGRFVGTTGYGDLFDPGDATRRYTASYGGTSAAAPMVAGALTAAIGVLTADGAPPPSVEALRRALRATGTPIAGDVGPRPDLPRLLEHLGARPTFLATRRGARIQLTLRGDPRTPFAIAFATREASRQLPGLGRLRIDPESVFTTVTGHFDEHGRAELELPWHAPPTDATATVVHAQLVAVRRGRPRLHGHVALELR